VTFYFPTLLNNGALLADNAQLETLYEIGGAIKGLTDWIASVAGAALVLIGLSVFLYWLYANRKIRISLWGFIFWNPASTYKQFCFKGKMYAEKPEFEFEFCKENEAYITDTFTVIPTPAITLRGQLINPSIWPDFYDDAELTVKLANDSQRQKNEISSSSLLSLFSNRR
jgi:hypothetical protein